MNEEFTTQVDEACEDTNNHDQCYLREIHKRFCETYRSQRALWYMWKNRISLKNFYNKEIKVKKELNMLMKVWLQPPFKTPLIKHLKKRPKIDK